MISHTFHQKIIKSSFIKRNLALKGFKKKLQKKRRQSKLSILESTNTILFNTFQPTFLQPEVTVNHAQVPKVDPEMPSLAKIPVTADDDDSPDDEDDQEDDDVPDLVETDSEYDSDSDYESEPNDFDSNYDETPDQVSDGSHLSDSHSYIDLETYETEGQDLDIDDIVAHAAASEGSSTMLRPWFCTMYSNSWRKCFRKLCTGHAAASPSAQIV